MKSFVSPTTRLVLIVEFIVAIYMLIALTTSEYESYKVEQYIERFEVENQELAIENENLKDEYDYFTSPQYQEKIAKQNFGLINPGEKILVIPEKNKLNDAEQFESELISEKEQFYMEMSNPVKWWYFFFN